ncbi:hypothetical protein WICMUC_003774 [Wickerhamomyces mucosus]|uniref:Uncharacterized protein n=1 Tax=Wickerhamomyces mucosus TaxID=1378264 RepID=A0A9P8PKY6_9ASCO|nr:hypothetical protein WICMUC_003774 [Wickerhamomyces mucosus]
MFSPSAWISGNTTDNFEDSDTSLLSVSQIENQRHLSQQPFFGSSFNTPSKRPNPIDEFQRLQNQGLNDSPNAKLASFFANKGSAPLTDIELEGVKALLAQTQSNHGTPISSKPSSRESSIGLEYNNVLKAESGKLALNTTPSFKANYNTSLDSEGDTSLDSLNSTASSSVTPFKRRVFDYSGFPSPYRTAKLKSSALFLNLDYEKNKPTKQSFEEKVEEKRPLSSTASALLSFLDNNQEEKEKKTEDGKIIDYANPYASTKKSKKPINNTPINKQPTNFEKLEKKLTSKSSSTSTQQLSESNDRASTSSFVQPTQPISEINKYKPAKSSALRESITVDDNEEEEEEEEDDDDMKDKSTTPSLEVTQNSKDSIEDDGKSGLKLPSKPKETSNSSSFPNFSFGKTSTSTQVELKPITEVSSKSTFSFQSSDNSINSEKPNIPTSTFSLISNTKPVESSTETSKPGVIFDSKDITQQSSNISSKTKDGILSQTPAKGTSSIQTLESTNNSLTIRPSQDVETIPQSSNGSLFSSTPSLEFKFPSAEGLGYTATDIDDSQVAKYKNYFAF